MDNAIKLVHARVCLYLFTYIVPEEIPLSTLRTVAIKMSQCVLLKQLELYDEAAAPFASALFNAKRVRDTLPATKRALFDTAYECKLKQPHHIIFTKCDGETQKMRLNQDAVLAVFCAHKLLHVGHSIAKRCIDGTTVQENELDAPTPRSPDDFHIFVDKIASEDALKKEAAEFLEFHAGFTELVPEETPENISAVWTHEFQVLPNSKSTSSASPRICSGLA